MNEAETRAEQLKARGWGVVDHSKVLREHPITAGKSQTGAGRTQPLKADYVLVYQGRKIAVIEAKSDVIWVTVPSGLPVLGHHPDGITPQYFIVDSRDGEFCFQTL